VSHELKSEIRELLLVTITKEMKMKYENGNIILDSHEVDLLTMISGSEPYSTNGILAFLYWNDSVKDGAHELLWTMAADEDKEFLQNEKRIRSTVDFTTMICKKFNERALQLAREAGHPVDFY